MSAQLRPEFILRLQSQIGNRGVTQLLRRLGTATVRTEVVQAEPAAETPATSAVVEVTVESAPTVVVGPAPPTGTETLVPVGGWQRISAWMSGLIKRPGRESGSVRDPTSSGREGERDR